MGRRSKRRGEAAFQIPPFSSVSYGATGSNAANAAAGRLVTRCAATFAPNETNASHGHHNKVIYWFANIIIWFSAIDLSPFHTRRVNIIAKASDPPRSIKSIHGFFFFA
ncbi:hypothetical protein KSP40_PGU020439 [Platanthera guangdongensis]|uniref:Uncharacterized protein n=1 Tax=Platanthera guangdongensis TaxID=2320717 RepID=A0ABR2MKP4_9ASPA